MIEFCGVIRRVAAGLMVLGLAGGTGVAGPLRVVRDAEAIYASARDLERGAGIAVKALSDGVYVACSDDRCVLLRSVRSTGDEVQVELNELARSLGAELEFGAGRSEVTLVVKAAAEAPGSAGQPGTLAPELELAGLNGGKVSLAQFRGRRVLINSWASW